MTYEFINGNVVAVKNDIEKKLEAMFDGCVKAALKRVHPATNGGITYNDTNLRIEVQTAMYIFYENLARKLKVNYAGDEMDSFIADQYSSCLQAVRAAMA
jgi:hypothetical protein